MLCTKVMVTVEYVPNDLLGIGERLVTIAQNCQSLVCIHLWGFPWFLLQLQLTNCLRIVLIYMVLQISPQIKIRGFKSGEWGAHSTSHFLQISLSWNRTLSQSTVRFDVCGVTSSCWNHWSSRSVYLRRPSDAQNLFSTATERSLFTIWALSFSSSNQYGPIMPCLEMATQGVLFTECNDLCKTSSGGAVPQ